MNNAQLQLVFLGQLIDGSDCATAPPAAATAKGEDAPLVIRHDLGPHEARRMAALIPETSSLLAGYERAVPERQGDTLPPFPPLVVDEAPPAPVRRVEPARATRLDLPSIASIRAARAVKPASAPEVCCPNCGERQTMRVMCRGCASLLEVALKAQAERHAERKALSRAGGFLARLGL